MYIETVEMKNLRDFTYEELLDEVKALEEKPYRAEQIYGWVYRKSARSIDEMTDISKALRERLKGIYSIEGITVVDVRTSFDGTRKFLSELADGSRIESVLIREGDRLTLCVSSQAGCALGCRFCMTGLSGFTRNLTLAELNGQVFAAREIIDYDETITNIVLMGMGEPLNNIDNVIRFTSILSDGKGFGFSHNKVTVSTAGVVPGIKRLAAEANVNLAVSLNATTDEVRDRIMPINKKYPLESLLEALRGYPYPGKKHITVEYVMLADLNDSIEDAGRLARMLRGIPCKINLIPFNPFEGSRYSAPDNKRVSAFSKFLQDSGYVAIVRASKGADILAACGQLKGRYEETTQEPGVE